MPLFLVTGFFAAGFAFIAVVTEAGVVTAFASFAEAFGDAEAIGFVTTAAGLAVAGAPVVVVGVAGSGSAIGVTADVGFGIGFATDAAMYASRPASFSNRRL